MTPEADREAVYRRLYRVWPECLPLQALADELDGTGPGVTTRAYGAVVSLRVARRLEWFNGFHRVNMGIT